MKKFWLVVILIAVVVITYLLWQSKAPQEGEVSDVDTSAVINQELDALNTADLEKEFEAIDTDLNSL